MLNQLNQQQMPQHVTILGWLHMISGIILLLIGCFIFLLLTTIGVVSGDHQASSILSVIGTFLVIFFTLYGIPGVVAGYGLLARKAWARYLAIIISILGIFNFPIGTLVSAYTLWVLFQEDAPGYFDRSSS